MTQATPGIPLIYDTMDDDFTQGKLGTVKEKKKGY